jgi:hypothetical protein
MIPGKCRISGAKVPPFRRNPASGLSEGACASTYRPMTLADGDIPESNSLQGLVSRFSKTPWRFILIALMVFLKPTVANSEGEVLEFSCRSCGYRAQFVQGYNPSELERNIQNVIVVCERSGQIRNVKIALNPDAPTKGEPLLARRDGSGYSEMLGLRLPRFLVPGNTCPLFPITAYLERNICPINGEPGLEYGVVSQF